MFKIYIICFFLPLLLSMFFVPVSIFISKKFNVYDIPDRRKVHTRPIPRWGGLGIFLTYLSSFLIIKTAFPIMEELLANKLKFTSGILGTVSLEIQVTGILAGMACVLILGMIDDKKSIGALIKLLIQIIAAYCTMDFGVRITGLVLPFNKYWTFPILVSQFFTILWLVGFMNTINLADGLDGLAAGIVGIASGTFFVVSLLQQTQTTDITIINQLKMSAFLSMLLCGTSLGFLFFNFNPARVFMGDSGALILGFLLGSISIIGTLKTTAVIALFIPIIIVALPVVDVIFSIYRRLRKGLSIGQPDKQHLHHRLLGWGWSQREVVLFMYVITLILSIIAITITALQNKI